MHSNEIRQKAFAMYCSDIVPNRIADLLGLKDATAVYRWVNKYQWEEKRREILKFKENSATLSEKEQDLKIVESILAMYGMAIKQNQGEMLKKLNYKDVIEAVKLRRLLKDESTENINIVNNEIDIFKSEIEKIKEKHNREGVNE